MFSALARRLRLTSRGRTATLASLIGVVLIAAIGATAVLTTHQAKADTPTATVNVDGIIDVQIPGSAVGTNEQAWDTNMLDASYPGLLKSAGMQIMRYPGGSTADNFHWYNQSVDNSTLPEWQGGGTVAPNITFDAFMNTVQAAGAQAMITLNYGSGSLGEANSWLYYANESQGGNPHIPGYPGSNGIQPTYPGYSPTGHAYGIKYWEIGNEVYGDGTYGQGASQWEYNRRKTFTGQPALGPVNYADTVDAWSQTLRQTDPTIKIGVVLVPPTNWPETAAIPSGIKVKAGITGLWNQRALPALILGSSIFTGIRNRPHTTTIPARKAIANCWPHLKAVSLAAQETLPRWFHSCGRRSRPTAEPMPATSRSW
jgi:hypothetical protein